MRRTTIELKREKLLLSEEIEGFFEKTVTRFGRGGAKIDCPGRFVGKRVLVIVCKE